MSALWLFVLACGTEPETVATGDQVAIKEIEFTCDEALQGVSAPELRDTMWDAEACNMLGCWRYNAGPGWPRTVEYDAETEELFIDCGSFSVADTFVRIRYLEITAL
ncbi:MAG: hypothetical protein AAFV53_16590 [Myxococcota bacterium]